MHIHQPRLLLQGFIYNLLVHLPLEDFWRTADPKRNPLPAIPSEGSFEYTIRLRLKRYVRIQVDVLLAVQLANSISKQCGELLRKRLLGQLLASLPDCKHFLAK